MSAVVGVALAAKSGEGRIVLGRQERAVVGMGGESGAALVELLRRRSGVGVAPVEIVLEEGVPSEGAALRGGTSAPGLDEGAELGPGKGIRIVVEVDDQETPTVFSPLDFGDFGHLASWSSFVSRRFVVEEGLDSFVEVVEGVDEGGLREVRGAEHGDVAVNVEGFEAEEPLLGGLPPLVGVALREDELGEGVPRRELREEGRASAAGHAPGGVAEAAEVRGEVHGEGGVVPG
mmetsp:Transcript_33065/g.105531  ORF Transcript_33065/g.105531 Transcript_33065/m.105531 type:complete len:233 (-) Transcript_33065:1070-1768(-)